MDKTERKPALEIVLDLLKEKACTKQEVYTNTLEVFEEIKKRLKDTQVELLKKMSGIDNNIEFFYEEKGTFEANLTFGGDILVLTMHTNVFGFNDEHFVAKSKYVQEDFKRGYCGIISMYNFLKDSLKYKRINDVGYLIGRIFINKEKHFFMEGKRQLGFLYNDFENNILDENYIKAIIESAMIYCLDFDLLTPPYNSVNEMSVSEKIQQAGALSFKTGKRLGFKFQADGDDVL